MYVIAVYDVGIDRLNKVRIFLKQYLNWVQNSVFEGELTKAEYMKVRSEVKELIDEDFDCVFFYHVKDKKYLGFDEMGARKTNIDTII
ncbi:CRISPR-associated endonuclease Cas2 [Methanohalophilus euhalobius]|uniref:CRISPR-associated endoribonuclease Cas2 n=1 Tax=Methanohalophilus euhalobius TaxID=51203 RepID=A0A314ZNW4_9EURY|nr:CRISPR-associated endonuclease Cas2 [Methanohalophilus euhalobius]PQV42765.1 CRISPR-associated Cas2 family protein [Methanohalophilus euhalobius]RNI10550.1 CRISPR-associated endonuclease Cas2 [Methanohalophilus euhalobius]